MRSTRKIYAVISWIPVAVLKILLVILGLIAVPLALLTQRMTLDKADPDHWPDLFWLWGNDEEGCPDWWHTKAANGEAGRVAEWFPQFWWYAIRNPVNNFRYLFTDVALEHCGIYSNWSTRNPMEAAWLIRAEQQMAFRWVWNSWWAGYRRVWITTYEKDVTFLGWTLLKAGTYYSEVWIGWKLGSIVPGLGFAMQVRFNREVGQ